MINLLILPDEFALYQFDRHYRPPSVWLDALPWYTISKTAHELSVLCPVVPAKHATNIETTASKAEKGWRCFQVEGQMDFSLVGILAAIIDPLRKSNVPVFAVSTYDTDYVLVKDAMLEKAINALHQQKGLTIKPGASILL
ncbi:ACT domain-containing protein [Dichotomocladium elegans]|nr:ACT domain-containing protein [Dichotomocladium elegans]